MRGLACCEVERGLVRRECEARHAVRARHHLGKRVHRCTDPHAAVAGDVVGDYAHEEARLGQVGNHHLAKVGRRGDGGGIERDSLGARAQRRGHLVEVHNAARGPQQVERAAAANGTAGPRRGRGVERRKRIHACLCCKAEAYCRRCRIPYHVNAAAVERTHAVHNSAVLRRAETCDALDAREHDAGDCARCCGKEGRGRARRRARRGRNARDKERGAVARASEGPERKVRAAYCEATAGNGSGRQQHAGRRVSIKRHGSCSRRESAPVDHAQPQHHEARGGPRQRQWTRSC